jgi:signal transduction histidine kinase
MASRRIAINGRPLRKQSVRDFQAAVQAAKMQAMYHFAYGLSHEINNPLANIATRAQTLLVDEQDADRRRKLTTIVQQAFRAHEMIADLMLFARPPAPELRSVDVSALAATVVAEMQPLAQEQATRLVFCDSKSSKATLDPVQVGVALKALVQNALEALRTGGHVQVAAKRSGKAAAGEVALTVSDDGPGIPDDVQPHIFDPFFCGREAGRGLGLGLSKAWRIVDLHGGRIDIVSGVGQGAVFTMTLPAHPAAYAPRTRK